MRINVFAYIHAFAYKEEKLVSMCYKDNLDFFDMLNYMLLNCRVSG